jgi:hypothetical protein
VMVNEASIGETAIQEILILDPQDLGDIQFWNEYLLRY